MEVTYGPELRLIPPPHKPFRSFFRRRTAGARHGQALPLVPRRIIDWMVKRLLVTWQHPENSLFDDGAILVNSRGEAFATRRPHRHERSALPASRARSPTSFWTGGWSRLRSVAAFRFHAPEIAYAYVDDYLRLRPDVTAQADAPQRLAEMRRLPSGPFRTSIDDFNRYARGKMPDRFGAAATAARWPAAAGLCWGRSRPTSRPPKAAPPSTKGSKCSTARVVRSKACTP